MVLFMISRNKVAIIGAGAVGSATAFSLITQGVCDEVVLIDINQNRAAAEAKDLIHSIDFLNRNVRVTSGSYADCADANIVVITASVPLIPGQTRLDMLASASRIIRSIVAPIMDSGFDGHFVVISNPVDIMSYYVYRLSGLPKQQVIGTGTALDSARLKCFIGELIDVDPRSIMAFSMGEHGDSQMVPWSCVTIGGKSFQQIWEDNQDRVAGVDREDLVRKTIGAGWEIADYKGTTNYGIASTTVGIIRALLYDENRIIPVSTLLEGEYGEEGVFAGVPAVISRVGVKEVVRVHMTDEELAAFRRSVAVIREYCGKLEF